MSAKKTTRTATAAKPSAGLLESPGGRWSISRATSASGPRASRGGGQPAAPDGALPAFLSGPDFEVLDRIEARPATDRRGPAGVGGSMVPLVATVPAAAVVMLVARQESGALSFHRPTAAGGGRRGPGAAGETRVSFEVPVLDGDPTAGRRGPLTKLVRVVLVKIADKVVGELVEHAAEWLMPKLAGLLEKRIWQHRTAGWLRVTADGLAAPEDHLAAGIPAFVSPERGLLLIHGTFSTAHGGFGKLAGTDFFQQAEPLYGRNIFAFNHFTFSKTPAENVRELLDGLPDRDFEFDVITHSRGGLVIRELLEGAGLKHPKRKRLRIGRVILVASPCMGTPLASEARWSGMLSHLANLLEMLPDNPFTTGGAWLAEALKWFAANVLGNCPGLVVMDPQGEFIDAIQNRPDTPAGLPYHALVSNYQPEQEFLGRMADMGLDRLFGGANDIVVPTEGSWKTGDAAAAWIPAGRIACCGPGGNLTTPQAVHHCNYFAQPGAVAFILACLRGEAPELPALDPAAVLPSRSLRVTRGPATPENTTRR